MCLYTRVCNQWGRAQTEGGCVPHLPGPLPVVTDIPVWLVSCIWGTACHGNGITVGEMLGCLHPALYKMLWCSTASKKAKYMVVKMTSASSCLTLVIPKTSRRTRAKAGLGGRSKQVRARKSRVMGTLCCTVWDKLTACTSYWHKEDPKACLSFLSCAWGFNHVPLDSERVHIQLVGVLHPFLHTSKSAAQPLCPDWRAKVAFLDTSMEN